MITGGSGLLGRSLTSHFSKNFETVSLYKENKPLKSANSFQKLDLTNFTECARFFELVKPDLVIHTAAFTDVDGCEIFPEKSNLLNFQTTKNIVDLSIINNNFLVFISTDQIYDGKSSLYNEKAPTNAINNYGISKIKCERYILEYLNLKSLIIRTNFFGVSKSPKPSFSDWVTANLVNQKEQKYFDNIFYTPIYIPTLLVLMEKIIFKRSTGIFNICSDERISKFDFANLLCSKLELDKKFILKSSYSPDKLSAIRPLDMSLSNQKIKEKLNCSIDSIDDQLDQLVIEYLKSP